MAGDRHELGEGGSSQDGEVGGLELGDLKIDVLSAVLVSLMLNLNRYSASAQNSPV